MNSAEGRAVIRRLTRHACSPRVAELRTMQDGTAPARLVKKFADEGLLRHSDGQGPPVLTPVGMGFVMAADLGVSFFDVCVLAKTYRVARSLSDCGQHHRHIPLPTVQHFFEDWPVCGLRVQIALSSLRRRGLLPRAGRRRIACDVESLGGIKDHLLGISDWVDETSEEVRRILLSSDD